MAKLKSLKPRQECSYCHGTGRFKTTRNPMGQFDFWELGDRVLNDELKEIEWPSKQPIKTGQGENP